MRPNGLIPELVDGYHIQRIALAMPSVPVPRQRELLALCQSTGAATHTVLAGDTLYSIARRYGTTVSELTALNSLPSAESIRVGQVLIIP